MAEVSYLARFGLVQDARTAGLFFNKSTQAVPSVITTAYFKKTKNLSSCVAILAHQCQVLGVGFFTFSSSAPLAYHGAGAGLP